MQLNDHYFKYIWNNIVDSVVTCKTFETELINVEKFSVIQKVLYTTKVWRGKKIGEEYSGYILSHTRLV